MKIFRDPKLRSKDAGDCHASAIAKEVYVTDVIDGHSDRCVH